MGHYPVQISVGRIWHVIVDDNVDALNVYSPANQVCRYKNPFVTFLEALVAGQSAKRIPLVNLSAWYLPFKRKSITGKFVPLVK